MPSTVKRCERISPTDRFMEAFVSFLYYEGYNIQGYIQMPVEWWVKDKIAELHWTQADKERAYKLVE